MFVLFFVHLNFQSVKLLYQNCNIVLFSSFYPMKKKENQNNKTLPYVWIVNWGVYSLTTKKKKNLLNHYSNTEDENKFILYVVIISIQK